MEPVIHLYIRGAIAMGFLVASAFFFRFWRETHDRLFAFFAAAFFLLAINGPVVRSLIQDSDNSIMLYVTRLVAYVIILIAIVDKNLRRT